MIRIRPLPLPFALLLLMTWTLVRPAVAACDGSIGWLRAFGDLGLGNAAHSATVGDLGSGPRLFVGGQFTTAGPISANRIAAWDGGRWSALGSGINGNVYALVTFNDGNGPALYAAGEFTSAGGVTVQNIAKWNGTAWSALGSGLNARVEALVVHDDGGGPALYAGGLFTNAGGTTANRIAKWNGSSWSALGTGLGSTAYALLSFNDGSGAALYVGGQFTDAGGATANRIAKWNGSAWSTLGTGMGGTVRALAAFDGGGGNRLVAAGEFTTAGGATRTRIAAWDGAGWSALADGLDNTVRSLATADVGAGTRLYAAGSFTASGSTALARITAWDGTAWSALGSGLSGSINRVDAIAVLDLGFGPTVCAAGLFSASGSIRNLHVAAWGCDRSGSLAMVTQPSTNATGGEALDTQPQVRLLGRNGNPARIPRRAVRASIASGGGTLVGDTVAWTDADGIARFGELAIVGVAGDRTLAFSTTGLDGIESDAIAVTAPDPCTGLSGWISDSTVHSVNGLVRCAARFDDGSGPSLYVGGDFTTAGGVTVNRIARWDGDGWAAVGTGMNGAVHALCVFDDGTGEALYAGGMFTIAGGNSAAFIAKWNGTAWSALGNQSGGHVFAMVVHDDGSGPSLFAAGGFTSAGGASIKGIARFNGAAWLPVGGDLSGGIAHGKALAVFDAGSGPELYVGGWFTSVAGVAANGIARWNGSAWSALSGGTGGSGVSPYVNALATFDDGNGLGLYAGGEFTTAGGVTVNRIARWSGSAWSALGTGVNNHVLSLAAGDSGEGPSLHAGGSFTTASGSTANRVARWDGSAWAALGGGLTGTGAEVRCLAVMPDADRGSALLVGGTFASAGGATATNVARYACPVIPAAGLAIVTAPASTSPPTVAFTTQPSVRLVAADGDPVATAGVSVTAAIASGTGSLTGTLTASTDASGVATFTDLATSDAGSFTLVFSSSGLASATSAAFSICTGVTGWADLDGDGFGNASDSAVACSLPSGRVANDDDCDDTRPEIGAATTWYADDDGDGTGYAGDGTSVACIQHAGHVAIEGDGCPSDANKTAGGACGCGNAETGDSDSDGAADCVDGCPADAAKVAPGICGCGNAETDGDTDGTADCVDGCPSDANKIAAGDCGCGVADTDANANGTSDCLEQVDSDGDGLPDSSDGCPLDATKVAPGICGCGAVEEDVNGNWFLDCLEGLVSMQVSLLSDASALAGDGFGASLAAVGDRVAVGVPWADVAGTADACRVLVMRWDGSAWSVEAELLASAASAGGRFGSAVAFDGDLVAVGSPLASAGGQAAAGTVSIFRRSGSTWSLESTVIRATPLAGDGFGSAVALRGDFLAVGAPQADPSGKVDAGEATVFRFDGSSWVRTGTAVSSPVTAGDRYGASLDLGGPSATPVLAVGATGDDETGAANCGAVYLRNVAADGTTSPRTRLVTPARAGAALGSCVAISAGGDWVAAGAPLADIPTVGVDAGSISTWTLIGSSWSVQTFLPEGQAANERFGTSVALGDNGSKMVVGSPLRTSGGTVGRGVATVFSRLGGGSWDMGVTIDPSVTGGSPAGFGTSVAFFAGGIVVGGPQQDPPAGGAVVHFGDAIDCVSDDTDGDGMGDACDACPLDATKIWPETCGCGQPETDTDLDGTADCLDGCPSDATKLTPGTCGCGTSDVDTDSDTVSDCFDSDDDDDGTADTSDGCPLSAIKTAPGTCGCAVADTDTDSDGTPDCNDLCPSDATKVALGVCGCGVADVDADGDDLTDCLGQGNLPETGTVPMTGVLSGDDFGASVSGDGNFALVGLPLDDVPGKSDAGSARISEWTGSSWVQVAELVAPSADAKSKDYFGTSVSVQGEVAVVGASNADLGGTLDAGAAYVYRNVGGTWTYEAKLTRAGAAASDRFGSSVAVLGDFIAVGAPLANAGGKTDSGEVRVFQRISGTWTPTATVTAGILTASDKFGQAVSLGGSASTPTLVVGCPGDDETGKSNCGAAYIHVLTGSGTVSTVARVVSPASLSNAGLGTSVSVDATGLRVAAGAPLADVPGVGTDCGSVTVWTFGGSAWMGVEVAPADRTAGENFGASVSLRADGLALVAGSPLDRVANVTGRGSAAVLTFNGTSWSTYDRLTLPNTGTSASNFGRSVAFRGASVLVGGPKHTPPAGGTVRGFEGP